MSDKDTQGASEEAKTAEDAGTEPLNLYQTTDTVRQRIWKFTQTFEGIEKERTADTGKFNYAYFNVDDLYNLAKPVMTACGLGSSNSIKMLPEGTAVLVIEVFCLEDHQVNDQMQRSPDRFTTSELPLPSVADIRAFGSTLTYLRRYGLVNALNITVPGDDDDGFQAELAMKAEEVGSAEGKPLEEIYSLLDKIKDGRQRAVDYINQQFGIEALDELSLKQAAAMKRTLKGIIRNEGEHDADSA